MINLLDDYNKSKFGHLYHVSDTGHVTCVCYGPGQLQLAKEYIPRNEKYYLHANGSNVWRVVLDPGHVRVIDHCDIPKEITLYLFLLGD